MSRIIIILQNRQLLCTSVHYNCFFDSKLIHPVAFRSVALCFLHHGISVYIYILF